MAELKGIQTVVTTVVSLALHLVALLDNLMAWQKAALMACLMVEHLVPPWAVYLDYPMAGLKASQLAGNLAMRWAAETDALMADHLDLTKAVHWALRSAALTVGL